MPSVEALVIYFYAASGYPERDKWLRAANVGNYDSWTGLTYLNATRYFPSVDDNIKGHMVQTRQGVRYTKPKNPHKRRVENFPEIDESTPGNEMYVQVVHKHILYTNDTGRFPIRSRSGNKYVMVAYHS